MNKIARKLWYLGMMLIATTLLHSVVNATDKDHDGVVDGLAPSQTQAIGGNFAGPVSLSVGIDENACMTGLVQCQDFGFGSPADDNQIPVAVTIQVQGRELGSPATGLASEAFSVDTAFVPAGGSSLKRIDCPDCFQEASNGVYRIFLKPIRDITWKSGSYFIQVQVSLTDQFGVEQVGRALAQINIPFE